MSYSVLCTDRAEVEATFRLLEEENRSNPHIVNGMMAPRYLSYDMDAQSVVIEYDVKDWEMNRVGILHGGILSTMLDHAAGITVAAFVGGWAPTVDLQVHFLRPGQPGDTILAVGRIISAGQTLVHAEASLTSKTTGTDSDMTVTVTGDDTLKGIIGSGALTEQVKSQNAVVNVNGIQIVRQTNTITDAIPGVTLTLKAQSTADETLTVTRSTDDNKKAITEWVTAYNSLQSTIASLTKYEPPAVGATAQSSNNGVLMGDSTIRGVQSDLRALLTNVQSGSYAIMAQLGITQDPVKGADGAVGNLKIDDKKLTKILTDDPAGVQAYFVGDGKTTGFATQMNNTLTDMLSTSVGKEGVIQNAKDGINATLKSIGKRYDAMELTIEATMARYKKQFNDLDKLVTKFNGTATYLTQQFSSK